MRIGPYKKIAVNGVFFKKMLILSVGTLVDFYEMIPWLALTRATLISTGKINKMPTLNDGCQCPHTGNTHFYEEGRQVQGEHAGCVNALTRATLISTKDFRKAERKWQKVSMPSHGQHSFLPSVIL